MQPNQPLTLADHRLLDLVWPNQPLPSGRLCQIAQEQLGWKRTTTYTVLKRLCDKGYLKNEASVVTALVDRATVQRADGQEVLQRSFQGSLPSFLAAFLQAGTVSRPGGGGDRPDVGRLPPQPLTCPGSFHLPL